MPLFSFLTGQAKAFALDFSDNALQLLETRGNTKNPEVHSYQRLDIPEGIFERGLILNQAGAIEAIQKLVADAAPSPPSTKKVVAELPETLTFLHHFSIPSHISKDDLSDAVLEQVAATMPFTIDEYAWDFSVLEKTSDGTEVLFAAAQADVVTAYEQTLALAGLELVALEPESASLSRVLLPQLNLKNNLALLIDFGGRETTIILADAAGIRLSVTRPEGGRSMTQTIAKKTKLTEKVAEQRKCLKGLNDKTLAPAIQSALAPIIAECKNAIAYQTRLSPFPVSGILLAGGGSRLAGLPAYLHDQLGLPVQLGAPTVTIDSVDPQELVTISGLALRASTLASGLNFIVPAS